MPTVSPRIRTLDSLRSTTLMPLRVRKPSLPVVTGIVLMTRPLRRTVIRWVAESVTASIRSAMVNCTASEGPP